jgi:release factor glutamine methyltransferase
LKNAIKYLVSHTYQPLLKKYLSKNRWYRSHGVQLEVAAGVFHPGFFFSTHTLLDYLESFSLKGKKFLELGAGSGLIAFYAAKNNAIVTASDINPRVVEYLEKNAARNMVELRSIQSDLFDDIPVTKFDVIAINPPYYKKQPANPGDYAWYCGAEGEYFIKLFRQLGDFKHDHTKILMVVSEDCDVELIKTAAAENGFRLVKALTRMVNWEYLYIYEICSSARK